ncbi:4,5-DOPA dioxygenase extradiol [Desulfitobacterium metallireducens]|uniref:Aromatic ring-cleaving dioxygenase n=1 Tax=Desulfitobacterium metallireducens DSM 15288 TaxID=871968 RepID=W0E5D9_9FIRM|nr:4,5-DOPA dioxygenase extradiol [Desulfitobacterium metallireducens]AHF06085.1 aromatic ring-cleaving dioxygenase [Desulfitobacterium metallireducens DSM 15288]
MNKMPVVFIGHGSPMNAIEDNPFTQNWIKLADKIPKPKAILAISAHWSTEGTRIMDDPHPKTIYDMYGFPQELYKVDFQPEGAPDIAHFTKDLISQSTQLDNSWGIDHGTWSILKVMYPKADIPVFQMSVNQDKNPDYHFEIGKEIKALREKGVLILGSGNVVHNLSKIKWEMKSGNDWALEFDNYIKSKVMKREYKDILNYKKAGSSAELAVPTSEHFDPLLYVLGASDESDHLSIYNDTCTMGSLSMTSYLFTN